MKKPTWKSLLLILALILQGQAFSQITVSDEKLQKVAELYETSLVEGEKFQESLDSLMQKNGMTPERLLEIQRMRNNIDLSEVEIETVKKIEQARSEFSDAFDEIIINKGMTPEEYRRILYEMQNDDELQERFTALFTID